MKIRLPPLDTMDIKLSGPYFVSLQMVYKFNHITVFKDHSNNIPSNISSIKHLTINTQNKPTITLSNNQKIM